MTTNSVKPTKDVISILVVDDDDDMCGALERSIKMEGHRATVVKNAHAAVSILAEKRFDLLFADVKLPDMDGFELVRTIRPDHPQLPCVVISGFYYNNDDAVQNALTDRLVIGYLSKPFLFDQFKRPRTAIPPKVLH